MSYLRKSHRRGEKVIIQVYTTLTGISEKF